MIYVNNNEYLWYLNEDLNIMIFCDIPFLYDI